MRLWIRARRWGRGGGRVLRLGRWFLGRVGGLDVVVVVDVCLVGRIC